jgi:Ca2+/Na+ antiporter
MTCNDWIPLAILELIVIFVFFGRASTEYLSPNLASLSQFLKLPQSIAGVTFAALGNSSPDLFSTVTAIQAGSLELALGELFGAANFIICIVVGSISMVNPCVISKWPFVRDVIASITISLILLSFLLVGKISFIGCLALMLYYALYVIIVIVFIPSQTDAELSTYDVESNQENTISQETEPLLQNESLSALESVVREGSTQIPTISTSVEIVSEEALSPLGDKTYQAQKLLFPIINLWQYANIFEKLYLLIGIPGDFVFGLTIPVVIYSQENDSNPWISFMHLLTYPWVVFLVFPNFWLVLSIIGFSLIIFLILLGFKISYNIFLASIGFFCSCTWIYILSNELVSLLQAFGILYSISESFLGSTVFALGNSLLDFLTNLKIAQLVI